MRRARPLLLAVGLCLALLMVSVGVGSRSAAVTTVASFPQPATLNYSPDPNVPLRPLTAGFIAQALGLTFAGPLAASAPVPAGRGTEVSANAPAPDVTSKTLSCVNGRQTIDPLSPPCSATFAGDNGGATYRGVSRTEVRVLIRLSGGTGDGESPPDLQDPFNRLYDLDQPVDPQGEPYKVTKLRLYERYFNRHYQTYSRHVHFYVYYDTSHDGFGAVNWAAGAERDLLFRVQPLAVVDAASQDGQTGQFDAAFAADRVVGFDSFDGGGIDKPANSDLLWGYTGSAAADAVRYASYICTKVVHQPVVWSGNPGQNGTPRRIGIVHVTPNTNYGLLFQRVYDLVVQRVRACGGDIVADATFSGTTCGSSSLLGPADDVAPEGAASMLSFKLAGVTTVLWPGCFTPEFGAPMTALDYYPEWVLLGDGGLDFPATPVADNSTVAFDHHAVVVTQAGVQPPLGQAQCYLAQREGDPSLPASYHDHLDYLAEGLSAQTIDDSENQARIACYVYPLFRELFSGIQLAGPRLTPTAIAKGLRGLGYISSTDPQFPSCYYDGAENACVQDSIAQYWDGSLACWRAIEGGRRYRAGRWPAGNIDAQITGNEPCNYAN